MKIINLKAWALIGLLFLISCSKDRDSEPDISRIKIASVSGIGDFTYQNDRLVAIGNERFHYDEAGHISGSRIYQIDTSRVYMQVEGQPYNPTLIERIERSSFLRDAGLVSMRIIDTLQSRSYSKLGSPDPLDPRYSYSLTTGLLAEKFFYKGALLDSISRVGYNNQTSNYAAKLHYNEQGDVVKITENIESSSSPFGSFSWLTKTQNEIEIAYDDKPNPFYYLYRETGMVLNKVKQFNFSQHNPVLIKTKSTTAGQSTLSFEQQIAYEYNAHGLPVKIKEQHPFGQKVTTISYK